MTVVGSTNVETFVFTALATAAVTVEEMTGIGLIEDWKTGGTAVFNQEALSVSGMQLLANISAHQDCYYPGINHAIVINVVPVQQLRRTTVNMTAWIDLMKSLSNKIIQTLISTRTYKTV